jgi:large subunit ribosomal protein L13
MRVMKMIIDATDSILGRIAVFAVGKAKEGTEVIIINCNNAIISGSRSYVFARYEHTMNMGTPGHGPFMSRESELIMKRTIRGMVEHKKSGGKAMLEKIRCYSGIPDEFAGKKAEKVPGAEISKLPTTKFVRMSELAKYLGGQ